MRKKIVLFLVSILGAGQTPPPLMEDAGKANLPAQRIGVDDLLAISVYRSPELTRTIRVNHDGSIRLPLLKDPIPAEGLMPTALEVAIREALKREGILVDPIVKVTVAEFASRPISVAGAVRKPVTFQAVGRVTLLDAIARAEGLSPDAASEILVSRQPADPSATPEPAQRISVSALIDAADPSLNFTLSGGEVIRVPEAGRIFVVGNVKRPGSYAIRDPADATILKVLAVAEGLAPYAGKRAYIYRADADSGDKREIEIELEKIMKRELDDMALQAGDVFYVPDNKGRRLTMSVIDRITNFGAATASGVLIWRR